MRAAPFTHVLVLCQVRGPLGGCAHGAPGLCYVDMDLLRAVSVYHKSIPKAALVFEVCDPLRVVAHTLRPASSSRPPLLMSSSFARSATLWVVAHTVRPACASVTLSRFVQCQTKIFKPKKFKLLRPSRFATQCGWLRTRCAQPRTPYACRLESFG